jgi:hypothetical protein
MTTIVATPEMSCNYFHRPSIEFRRRADVAEGQSMARMDMKMESLDIAIPWTRASMKIDGRVTRVTSDRRNSDNKRYRLLRGRIP